MAMSELHRIRLRGPWEISAPNETPRTVKLPATWAQAAGDSAPTSLRCERRFHRPTILAEFERVWLVVSEPCASFEIALNRQRLAGFSDRADVTEVLLEANVLTIDLAAPGDQNAELFTVTLEIEER
jgi:hypothetical protein